MSRSAKIVKCYLAVICLAAFLTGCMGLFNSSKISLPPISIPEPDPKAVAEVMAGLREEALVTWWGFDPNDSTNYLQDAIDSGVNRLIVPYVGRDWVVRPIRLRSNQEIVFEEGVVVSAKKGEFIDRKATLFTADGVENLIINGYGATFRMHKEDYTSPPYTPGEWRMGLRITGSKNVKVFGVTIRDTGGDGIYIGRGDLGYSEDIVIRDVISDNNHRQGMSVISVRNLLVENSVFKNTNGTLPMAGIDFEPNQGDELLEGIIVRNTVFDNNESSGIIVNLKPLGNDKNVTMTFEGILLRGNGSGINIKGLPGQHPGGNIEIRNCIVEDTRRNGLRIEHLDQASLEIAVEDCIFHDVANDYTPPSNPENPHTTVPLFLEGPNRIGSVRFNNVVVTDPMDRPSLYVGVGNTLGSEAFADIEGELQIISPHGANVRWGRRAPIPEALAGIRLQVVEKESVTLRYDEVVTLPDYRLAPLEVSVSSMPSLYYPANDPKEYTGENRLKNPEFEVGSTADASHWGATGGWGNVISRSTDAARSGTYGIKMETTLAEGYYISQSVFIDGGVDYELAAWARSSTNNQGRMKVEFYYDSGHVGGDRSAWFNTAGDWERISMVVNAPPEANRAVILLRISGPGVIHYDDVSFRKEVICTC